MPPDILVSMHSTEHLLNGTMVKMFRCDRSFSAHINRKKSKCDYNFDRSLTNEEIVEIENRVNKVIQSDLPVSIELMPINEAKKEFDLKRLPEHVTGNVRIIRIGDYDAIPCIGTHVESTGQIGGTFKISSTSFENDILRIRFKLT